jgi:DnaJ family protein A protein 2
MPSSLYEVLGVEKGVDGDAIRSAYRKLALKHHPDKGGDPEKFKEITRAYEVLSDDGRRRMYDITGSEDEMDVRGEGRGFGPGGPGMPFPFQFDLGSVFGMFGGGGPMGMGGGMGGPRREPQRRPGKAPPKLHEMPISLYDFYHGKKIHVKFERQRFCEGCKGSGAEAWDACQVCGGSGHQQHIMSIGPGMQTIMRSPCGACDAKGKRVSKVCSTCSGKKMLTHERKMEIVVEPGMSPGEVLIYPNECSDTHEYMEAGDLHIILLDADADQENGVKRAQGTPGGASDLYVEISIGLADSLLGCTSKIMGHPGHPQGLVVEIPAGVQNMGLLPVAGEGMPRRASGSATSKGSLYVRVHVKVTDAEKEVLRRHAEQLRGVFQGQAGQEFAQVT